MEISRREFLIRAAKAGAAAAVVGGGAYAIMDKNGPTGQAQESVIKLGDYSVKPVEGKVLSVVKGDDRSAMAAKAIELLGGIGRFVQKGDRVLVKPNAAFARAPFLCATTNPALVGEVVRLCYSAGAREVIVTDNPINDASSCFAISGIGKAAAGAGAKVMIPRDSYFSPYTLEGGKLIVDWPILWEPMRNVNKVISVVPIKDHHRSVASMSMKGWYGLLGGRRNIFHQDINTIIAELAAMVRPTLVILDGVEVMATNGPTGGSTSDLRKTRTLIASCDQVAGDAYGATLLGLEPNQLLYLQKAQELGAGVADWQKLKPIIAS
ncbi:MAG: Tat pathway signal protein [Planctomycetes bacterium GWF2_50_10]|nr:MAG: Tat pathway signal protein [Planctomycetes bacterium GWF2_50_10]